ncbi:MAG: hypothetical protein R8K21_02880 [Mariprofundales bacterium]
MLSQGLMKITGAKVLGIVISPISAIIVIGGVIIWKQNTQHTQLLRQIKKQDKNNNAKDIKAKPSVGSPFIKKPDNPHAIMFKQILDDNIALRAEPA